MSPNKYQKKNDKKSIDMDSLTSRLLSAEEERLLVQYLSSAARLPHNINNDYRDFRRLIFNFVRAHRIRCPDSWITSGEVGVEWFQAFVTRHCQLKLTKPSRRAVRKASKLKDGTENNRNETKDGGESQEKKKKKSKKTRKIKLWTCRNSPRNYKLQCRDSLVQLEPEPIFEWAYVEIRCSRRRNRTRQTKSPVDEEKVKNDPNKATDKCEADNHEADNHEADNHKADTCEADSRGEEKSNEPVNSEDYLMRRNFVKNVASSMENQMNALINMDLVDGLNTIRDIQFLMIDRLTRRYISMQNPRKKKEEAKKKEDEDKDKD